MLDWLVTNHAQLFTTVYVTAVLSIALAESFWPRRELHSAMGTRWLANLSISILCIAIVRLAFPFLMVGAAIWAQAKGIGLFNQWPLDGLTVFIFAMLVLDLGRYALHYMLHRAPLLWRLHRVHHTDRDYDFSTGLRFHPIEALFTTGFDLVLIILLGLPVGAVVVYSLIQLAWAIIAHANVRIPLRMDRVLRLVMVTPDLHRTHHSAEPGESMTNFGGVISLWDRLFGTYKDQPARGHREMHIGLSGHREPKEQRLSRMLVLPFLTK